MTERNAGETETYLGKTSSVKSNIDLKMECYPG